MLITRRSPLTGKVNTLDLPVTQAQLDEFQARNRGRLIQQIFPDLTSSQREFIKTGYTQADWDALFPPEAP
jgi:hypothetical protein